VVIESVIDANLAQTGLATGPMMTGLAVFFLFVVGWMVAFWRAFRLPGP
jgi:hypothetical protein